MADVKVYSPQGQLGTIPEDQVSSAQRLGYRVATPEDLAIEKTREEYGGLSGQLGAATTGVLSGATFGLSNVALKKLGAEEALKAYQSLPELQTARMAGELGGMIAPALLTGGTGVAARVAAATPAGLAARAGTAAAARVGAALGTAATTVGGTAARFAVQGATEAALQGIGQETARLAVDNELSGERIGQIAAAGLTSAALGAGIGASLGALGGVAKKAANIVPDDIAGTPIGRRIEAEIYRKQAAFKGMSEAEIAAAGELATPEMRAIALDADGYVDDLIQGKQAGPFAAPVAQEGSLVADLTAKAENSQRVAQAVRDSGLKRELLAGNVLDDAEALLKQRGFVFSQLDDITSKLDDAIAKGQLEYSQSGLKQLRVEIAKAKEAAEAALAKGGAEGAEELYVIADNAKRSVGRINARYEGLRSPTATDSAVMRDILEPAYEGLRVGLEDVPTWGKAAQFQAAKNAPLTRSIAKNDAIVREWYASSAAEIDPVNPWRRIRTSEPKKIRQNIADAKNGVSNADMDLRSQIEDENEFMKAVLKYGNVENAQQLAQDIAKQTTINNRIVATLDDAQKGVRVADFVGKLAGKSDSLMGIVAGAAIASGNPLFALMAPLMNTRLMMRGAEAVESIANNQAGRVGSAVARAGKAIASGAVATSQRLPVAGALMADFDKRSKRVRDLASQAPIVRRELERETEWMATRVPVARQAAINTALRQLDYLNANLPKGLAAPTPFAPALPPSKSEAARWMNRLRAVENPTSILDDLAKGKLTPEGVDAVRTVYPETFADIQAQVIDRLTQMEARGEKPAYAKRVELGLLLGIPTDPTMTPEAIASLQGQYQAQPAQAREGQAMPLGQARGRKAPDFASAFRSGSAETELTSEAKS